MNEKYQIFCDFDGTITKVDTIGEFLNRFADKKWLDVEKQWRNGQIGSRDCMIKQFSFIKNVSMSQLESFFNDIEIDETFIEFYNNVKKRNIKFTIVSDGFDIFIYNILKKYKLNDIDVFANRLKIKNGEFIPLYDDKYKDCKKQSGVCKCKVVEDKSIKDHEIIFIGDGLSDACVSGKISKIYAKNYLAQYLSSNNKPYIKFNSFNEIKI